MTSASVTPTLFYKNTTDFTVDLENVSLLKNELLSQNKTADN